MLPCLQTAMKTKLQDLDENTFNELIANKLCNGNTDEDSKTSDLSDTELKSRNQTDKHLNDSNEDIPVLVKEEPFTLSDGSDTSLERIQPKHSGTMYNLGTCKDKIKKRCSCKVCQSKANRIKTIHREEQDHEETTDSDDSYQETAMLPLNFKRTIKFNPSANKSFKCDVCNKRFRSYDILIRHSRTHPSEKNYECARCGQKFWSEHYLNVHYETLHNSVLVINTCQICKLQFRWKHELQEHLKTHVIAESEHKCNNCGKKFVNNMFLLEHMKTHAEIFYHQCHVCDARFLTEKSLHTHIKTHESKNPYTCVVCGEEFLFDNLLEQHILTHIGIYPYKCKACGAGFNHERHLKEHESTHTNMQLNSNLPGHVSAIPKLHESHKFRKLCSAGNNMAKTLIRHQGDAPCTCTICKLEYGGGKSFSKQYNYHTGGPYACGICGEIFLCKNILLDHEQIHLNENASNFRKKISNVEELSESENRQVFECDLCCDTFRTSKDLQSHFLRHSEREMINKFRRKKTIYDCSFCGEKFAKFKRLKCHLLIHSNITTCCCQACGKSFSQLKQLEEHVRIDHMTSSTCDTSESEKEGTTYSPARDSFIPDYHFNETVSLTSDVDRRTFINTDFSTEHQCDICDKKFVKEKELEDHILIHFKKNKIHARDVSKEIDNRMGKVSASIGKSPRYIEDTSLLQEHDNEMVPLKRIKRDPDDGGYGLATKIPQNSGHFIGNGPSVHSFVDQQTEQRDFVSNCSSNEKDMLILSPHPYIESDPFSTQIKSVGSSIESSSTFNSPRGSHSYAFSPRGKFLSDTDSGYSEKMNIALSDVESVYSPLGIDVNRTYTEKGGSVNTMDTTICNIKTEREEYDLGSTTLVSDVNDFNLESDTDILDSKIGVSAIHTKTPVSGYTLSSNETKSAASSCTFLSSQTKTAVSSCTFSPSQTKTAVSSCTFLPSQTKSAASSCTILPSQTKTAVSSCTFSPSQTKTAVSSCTLISSQPKADVSACTLSSSQSKCTATNDHNIMESSDHKQRVPFLFNYTEKKLKQHRTSTVNFHWLGKLK
ncbi:zinc finger protein 595-like isoform X2 [Mytilus edulis]|uniref:zinc finger protein 595-like isoform X2 n=1 Tax=Mytilus edulis TaxID=6550 RepID=UPI0039F111D3